MINDAQALLWDATALSSDAASTNTYDSGAAGNEIGQGEPLALEITVDVAADFTSSNETYQFNVIQSANADLSSPDILISRVILATDLTVGSKHVIPIPAGAKTKRYLGASFDGGGTTPTVTVTAFLRPLAQGRDGQKHYPKGYTIS